jgi:hypothetical protein
MLDAEPTPAATCPDAAAGQAASDAAAVTAVDASGAAAAVAVAGSRVQKQLPGHAAVLYGCSSFCKAKLQSWSNATAAEKMLYIIVPGGELGRKRDNWHASLNRVHTSVSSAHHFACVELTLAGVLAVIVLIESYPLQHDKLLFTASSDLHVVL